MFLFSFRSNRFNNSKFSVSLISLWLASKLARLTRLRTKGNKGTKTHQIKDASHSPFKREKIIAVSTILFVFNLINRSLNHTKCETK